MRRTALAIALALPVAIAAHPARAEPQAFETPEAAVDAVIAALEAADRNALVAVFGPESEDVILSGDPAADRQDWGDFLAAWREMHRIAMEGDEDEIAVLYIGRDQWPFPVELEKGEDGAWRFDAEGAREEIRLRRIGDNELAVMDLLRDYVRVQAAYRQIDYDGDGVKEFADAILSDPGQRNGLYWPAEPGTPESPIGDFVARASASGFDVEGQNVEPEPFLGYYYRILDAQGEAAPGGAYSYVLGGNMVAGHALLAFPSAWGETGVMSFMIGENGVLYEADLGENTLETAAAMETFDPDERWSPVAADAL